MIQNLSTHCIHQNYSDYHHFLHSEDDKVATYKSQELSTQKQALQHDEAEKNKRSFIYAHHRVILLQENNNNKTIAVE